MVSGDGLLVGKFRILKQRSLFKNDCFGIRRRLFVWRTIKRLKRINYLEAKQLENLLNVTLDIRCPCNEEQEKTLQWVCEKYDALFEEINNQMKRVKEKVGIDNMETVESLRLKQEIKRNITNDLKQSNDFDLAAIDKIIEVFDKISAEYIFRKRM